MRLKVRSPFRCCTVLPYPDVHVIPVQPLLAWMPDGCHNSTPTDLTRQVQTERSTSAPAGCYDPQLPLMWVILQEEARAPRAFGMRSARAEGVGAPVGNPFSSQETDALLAYLADQTGVLGTAGSGSGRANDKAAQREFERGTEGSFGNLTPRDSRADPPWGGDEGSARAYRRGSRVGFGEGTAEPGLSPDPEPRGHGSDPDRWEQQGRAAGGHQVKHAPVGVAHL
jgi:hypothetical protein